MQPVQPFFKFMGRQQRVLVCIAPDGFDFSGVNGALMKVIRERSITAIKIISPTSSTICTGKKSCPVFKRANICRRNIFGCSVGRSRSIRKQLCKRIIKTVRKLLVFYIIPQLFNNLRGGRIKMLMNIHRQQVMIQRCWIHPVDRSVLHTPATVQLHARAHSIRGHFGINSMGRIDLQQPSSLPCIDKKHTTAFQQLVARFTRRAPAFMMAEGSNASFTTRFMLPVAACPFSSRNP